MNSKQRKIFLTKVEHNTKVFCNPAYEKSFLKGLRFFGFKNKSEFVEKLLSILPITTLEDWEKINITKFAVAVNNFFSEKEARKRNQKAPLTKNEIREFDEYRQQYFKIWLSVQVEGLQENKTDTESDKKTEDTIFKGIDRLQGQTKFISGKPIIPEEFVNYLKDNVNQKHQQGESKSKEFVFEWKSGNRNTFSMRLYVDKCTEKPTDFETLFSKNEKIKWLGSPEFLAHLLYRLYHNKPKIINVRGSKGYFAVAEIYFDYSGKDENNRKLRDLCYEINKNPEKYSTIISSVDDLIKSLKLNS